MVWSSSMSLTTVISSSVASGMISIIADSKSLAVVSVVKLMDSDES